MKYFLKLVLLALLGALVLNLAHIGFEAATAPATSAPLLLGQTNPSKPIVGYARAVIYFCIIFGGLLGGFIYSISRNRGFVIPKRYSFKDGDNEFLKLGLGTFADMLVGLGGGILIFLLVPYAGEGDLITTLIESMGTTTEASSLLKVIALALIGGFAGISLFDEAAKRITRQIEEVGETARVNGEKLKDIGIATTREAEIQFLLSPLLDPTISPLNLKQQQALEKAIIDAPINVRNWVFSQAQSSLDNYWLMGQKGEQLSEADVETYRELFKQLILPFDALVQAAKKDQQETGHPDSYLHRYFAHIAFCQQQIAAADEILEASPEARRNWKLAEENLKEAVKIRNEISKKEIDGSEELFWHYELHLLLCHYKLNNLERAEEELKNIRSTWLRKEPGVLAGLLENLDSSFLEWVRSQDSTLISETLIPGVVKPSSRFGQRDDDFADSMPHGDGDSEFRNGNGHRSSSTPNRDDDRFSPPLDADEDHWQTSGF